MKQADPYNVIVADPQFLITQSLISLIQSSEQFVFTGLAENVEGLRKLLSSGPVDLLITDYNLIDYNGFSTLQQILNDYPQLHILILTNQTNRNDLNELSKIGIKNLVYKTADREDLFNAMDSSIRNKKYYSDDVLDLLVSGNQGKNEMQESYYLTPTEINMVKFIASGLTTKEIASKVNISFHTVMSHRKNIFRKLNVSSVSELIMYSIRAGLIDNIEYHI
jgi:DNA-binding NarL/FixJ family response regulator